LGIDSAEGVPYASAQAKGDHMADEPQPALTLDCIGLYCPEPLFQTRESIDSIDVG